MAAASESIPVGAPSPAAGASDRWLFGPVPDLGIGCGVLYVAIFALYCAAGDALYAYQPTFLLALFTLLFSAPHYGATLLRVYEQRSERRAYAIFSVWATLAVGIFFVAGLYDVRVGAAMATIYLTWSPWHYTGQNYGLSVMFLRRRRIEITPRTKQALYGSFILSYALTFFSLHMGDGRDLYTPAVQRGSAVGFLPIGIPPAISDIAVPLLATAYLACCAVAIGALRRSGSLRDLAPSLLLMGSQALWFTVPFSVRYWQVDSGLFPFRSTDFILWVLVAHALQYIWVTAYFAKQADRWSGFGSYLTKITVAGVAIWTLPVILFAPDRLGSLSGDAGLALLAASAVNIHHFILDGAIWKLKNSRIASILIRSEHGVVDPPEGRGIPRRLVWAVSGMAFVAAHVAFWQQIGLGSAFARDDYPAAASGLDRLAWVGKDDASMRHVLAARLQDAGEIQAARTQLERAVALNPLHLAAGVDLARLLGEQGESEAAQERLATVLSREPDFAPAHLQLGYELARHGQLDEALDHLERAAALSPEGSEALRAAGKLLEHQGNFDAAVDHYRRALEIAPDAAGHRLLGDALRVTGESEEAFEHYRLAEQLQQAAP